MTDDAAGVHLTDAEIAATLATTIRAYLTDNTDITRPSFHATAISHRLLPHLLAARAARSGQGEAVTALVSALERTEANFIAAVNGKPVRDMAETLAENRAALTAASTEADGRTLNTAVRAARSKPTTRRQRRPAASTTAQDAEGGEVERLRAAVEALADDWQLTWDLGQAMSEPVTRFLTCQTAADGLRAVLDRDTPNGGGA